MKALATPRESAAIAALRQPWLRQDEIDWFYRRADRATVLWMASTKSYLWHATADGVLSVCTPHVAMDRERNPAPGTQDRSNDTMTCERCQDLVCRIPMPPPRST